jgi:hypothetical protein
MATATKWTTPGVGFSEIDNTVRPNAEPGDGIGAIVINANRGYPNQRVLCTTIDKFHEYFGTPDNPNQFGHFAAQVYFEGGGATQLLAVRATQGDEGYAQIQYPYTGSTDKNHEQNVETLNFVDNNIDNQLKLINVFYTSQNKQTAENYYDDAVAKSQGFTTYKEMSEDGGESGAITSSYLYKAKSKRLITQDVYKKYAGDESINIYVHRYLTPDGVTPENGVIPGKAFIVFTNDGNKSVAQEKMFAIANKDGATAVESVSIPKQSPTTNLKTDLYWKTSGDKVIVTTGGTSVTYYDWIVHIPARLSLNGVEAFISFYRTTAPEGTTTLATLMNSTGSLTTVQNLAKTTISGFSDGTEVVKVDIVDWDDTLTKQFTVLKTDWESAEHKFVYGLKFTEYGTADSRFMLVTSATSKLCSTASQAELTAVADMYGVDIPDISNKNYAILTYQLAKDDTNEQIVALVVVDSVKYNENDATLGITSQNSAMTKYDNTWSLYLDFGTKKFVVSANYGVPVPGEANKPWQVDFDTAGDGVAKMYAISSTEVFSDPTGRWKDGYTPACKNDGEPGNGDIEMYQSNKTDQLVIGAIGPGEFGNDIGISIITPEAALIPALYHQNAFSWLNRYDDEDKINDPKSGGLDYRSNPLNLTWKKVYKINVYVKAPSKTQAVWGFGLDALTSSPVETFLVSNDPNAKDENGNSLWAPYVINGNSQFIYVSKKSVEASVNYKGQYEMPSMTWSIYQMTGGTNSKLNNVKEKTKALDLYKNRKKAYFDYLFNVEPVETFSGKQKYMAMMNRIGQIAMARKMDLGIIQCTSKEAKTIRLKLSEGKMFSFADGSYVAGYDDYDSYFDPFTSTWVMLPRSVAAAVACCYVDNYDKPWMAPAGVANGRIRYSDHPMVRLEDDEFGQLYAIHVNSSMYFPAYGEVIMGQKTMLKKESALNRIDIRKLCNLIEKRLESKLIPYLYQKNTTTNRSSMKTAVDTFLGRIQSGQGILNRDVKVIPDQKDTHLVYVNISFEPAESIERIEVTLILNRNTGTITPVESTTRI